MPAANTASAAPSIAATRRLIRFYRRLAHALALGAAISALALIPRLGLGAPETGLTLFDAHAPDRRVAAPSLAFDSATRVTGPVARTEISQRFRNDRDDWVEALYAFPLPDDAAVDALTIRIGARVIDGILEQTQEAERTYAAARADGRRAGLLSQHRPNLFTVALANIGPGEEVRVDLAFTQTLAMRDGAYSLTLPQTLTHRYRSPADPAGVEAPAAPGVPFDPAAPPRVDADARPAAAPPLGLVVDVVSGLPLREIASPTHDVQIVSEAPGRYRVTLAPDAARPAVADRDFVLTWTPRRGETPRGRLFVERTDKGTIALALIEPPRDARLPPPVARDFLFVVDTSGSMHGPGLAQAKRALAAALATLGPGDSFDLIAFSDTPRRLFGRPRPADAASLAAARAFVAGLEAEGGTEMRPALELALAAPGRAGALRQIVFLTDGGVADEAGMLALLRGGLDAARLFPIALGAAPNAWFMRQAARIGRGVATFLPGDGDPGPAVDALMARIARPAATALALYLDGQPAATLPGPLPDLLAGAPVHAVASLDAPPRQAVATAMLGGVPWSAELDIEILAPGAGLERVFGRALIEALSDAGRAAGDPALHRAAIAQASLDYGVLSPFTRWVAVDREPVRPAGAGLAAAPVPVAAPAGSAIGIMGPATASPMAIWLLLGLGGGLASALCLFLGRRTARA